MMSERPVKKRAVNLFVDAELLDEARRMRINVSETLERRLRTIVRAEQERRWLAENRDATRAAGSRTDSMEVAGLYLRYSTALAMYFTLSAGASPTTVTQ